MKQEIFRAETLSHSLYTSQSLVLGKKTLATFNVQI